MKKLTNKQLNEISVKLMDILDEAVNEEAGFIANDIADDFDDAVDIADQIMNNFKQHFIKTLKIKK